MRIAVFDPFSGAAGDMILGALIDAGLETGSLRTGLAALGITGYDLEVAQVNNHGLTGTSVSVQVEPGQPQRDWASIRPLIERSDLSDSVKATALAIFTTLAEAEAHVHGTSVETVHFHEVGAVDAIVDICGAAIGLDLLGIERVFALPPVTGSGWVRAQHGLMPVPAPATAQILASANVPLGRKLPEGESIGAELLTPTGAAILATLAEFSLPVFRAQRIGYGFGSMQLPWPNAIRVWIGEATETTESGSPHHHEHHPHHD